MQAREKYKFTPVRITFWVIMTALFSVGIYGWLTVRASMRPGPRERSACVLQQRNLQHAFRSYANMEGLKPGDTLDWSKVIGPGLFLETKPACPVHGESAYTYSPVIPEPGTLAAPCKDPEHRPADTKGW